MATRNRKNATAQPSSSASSSQPQIIKTSPSFLRPFPTLILPGLTASTPFAPSFHSAFKLLLIPRLFSALVAPIADCDEVFNYWEPTHYLQYGYGLQTWEYSPAYAIRSWAYAGLHAVVSTLFAPFAKDKINVFYLMRILFGVLCAYSESRFYRAVVENVNPVVGRYTFLALWGSAGMFVASTSYIPSTFAMYTTMMALSYAFKRPNSHPSNLSRTYGAIMWFALGSLLGWPFAAAVAIPFLLEELVVYGGEVDSRSESKKNEDHLEVKFLNNSWRRVRFLRILIAGIFVMLGLVITVVIDYTFYRKLVIVPLNIVLYNVFGDESRGPDIFDTEPWTYYIFNGLLNFNVIFLAALACLPIMTIAWILHRHPFLPSPSASTPAPLLLFIRMSPMYLWMLIFFLQSHKEERFLFVIYPFICYNAAVALYVVRGCIEAITLPSLKSSARFAVFRRNLPSLFVIAVFAIYLIVSLSRVLALHQNYQAPMSVYAHISAVEVPEILARRRLPTSAAKSDFTLADKSALGIVDPVFVCFGKEWFRFPSHYFLHPAARLGFLKSDFRGLLPGYFVIPEPPLDPEKKPRESEPEPERGTLLKQPWTFWDWNRDGTWQEPAMRMNDMNQEEHDRYTDISKCDLIVDSDLPSLPSTTSLFGPQSSAWKKSYCRPFLDASSSPRFTRAFYVPEFLSERIIGRRNVWGEYCVWKRA